MKRTWAAGPLCMAVIAACAGEPRETRDRVISSLDEAPSCDLASAGDPCMGELGSGVCAPSPGPASGELACIEDTANACDELVQEDAGEELPTEAGETSPVESPALESSDAGNLASANSLASAASSLSPTLRLAETRTCRPWAPHPTWCSLSTTVPRGWRISPREWCQKFNSQYGDHCCPPGTVARGGAYCDPTGQRCVAFGSATPDQLLAASDTQLASVHPALLPLLLRACVTQMGLPKLPRGPFDMVDYLPFCQNFARNGCKWLDKLIAKLLATENKTAAQKQTLEMALTIWDSVCAATGRN